VARRVEPVGEAVHAGVTGLLPLADSVRVELEQEPARATRSKADAVAPVPCDQVPALRGLDDGGGMLGRSRCTNAVETAAEVGSKSEEALNLLASWAVTLDEAEPANATDR
jgi:hypothetical protein